VLYVISLRPFLCVWQFVGLSRRLKRKRRRGASSRGVSGLAREAARRRRAKPLPASAAPSFASLIPASLWRREKRGSRLLAAVAAAAGKHYREHNAAAAEGVGAAASNEKQISAQAAWRRVSATAVISDSSAWLNLFSVLSLVASRPSISCMLIYSALPSAVSGGYM